MLNRVDLMGRIVRKPELKKTQSGTSVTNITLAVEDDYKSQNGEKPVNFIDVTAWRTTAELICRYLDKDRMAVISGRLATEQWQDNYNKTHKTIRVVADNVYFADSRKDNGAVSAPYAPPPQQASYAQQPNIDSEFEDLSNSEDDLPF